MGGGNVAAEDAVFLARICKKVYVVHRRDALRADQILQDRLFSFGNVEMLWDSVSVAIEGKEQVKALRIRNIKSGEERVIDADGVFIAVGIVPNTEIFRDFVQLDENGYIIAGEEGITNVPGVFAAGIFAQNHCVRW